MIDRPHPRADVIQPRCLDDAPNVRVACVGLALTLYLDEPMTWAREGAADILARFLQLGSPLQWFTTSLLEEWRRVSATGLRSMIDSFSHWLQGRPRHMFRLQLADDLTAPSAGFSYTEVDSAR